MEDKPVYKGDTLYRVSPNEIQELIIKDKSNSSNIDWLQFTNGDSEFANNCRQNLSWTKPKQKKQGWINVYPYNGGASWWSSKEEADEYCASNRLTCVPFEYEE